MAGIAAIVNLDGAPVDGDRVRALVNVPPYRASATCVWAAGPVGLAWTPLRPDAPEREPAQPHSLAVAGGRAWAVFDGRLDDRASLVAALTPATGRALSGASDVELLLCAYAAWGPSCGARLLGDFAACIWDDVTRTLVALRDAFGVKPLYYARGASTMVLGNVLAAVRRAAEDGRTLRDESVADLLVFGGVQEEGTTLFAGVSRVPPAHTLVLRPERSSWTLALSRHWALVPPRQVRYRRPEEYVEHFREVVTAAVRDRLGDGPVGLLMSGGLDSSSLAAFAAAARGRDAASSSLHAYTAVYDRLMPDDERHYSSIVAEALGVPIAHLAVDDYRLFDRWDADARPAEPVPEPLSAIMSDLLALAAARAPVLLTGDGGDPALIPATVCRHLGRVPLSQLVEGLWQCWRRGLRPPLGIGSSVRRWWHGHPDAVPPWLGEALRSSVDVPARLARFRLDGLPAAGGLRADAWSLLAHPWWSATFEAQDPGATGQPIETRHPFFDRRVVEFALGLPSLPWCVDKAVLRASTAALLPDVIRRRPKTPLAGDPVAVRVRGTVEDAVRWFDAVPEMRRFVDAGRFRATVTPERLMVDGAAGGLAAVCLARWLHADRAAPA